MRLMKRGLKRSGKEHLFISGEGFIYEIPSREFANAILN
jgi:hypothetical protein